MNSPELVDHLIDDHHYAIEYIDTLNMAALRDLHHQEHAGINQVGHDHT